jgi:GNAT superfamily N-acetyltransferase
MLRPAIPADLPMLLAIRDAAGVDALSDPALVIEAELRRLIATGLVTVWEEGGQVAGFAVADAGTIHLLVDTTRRGKGGGRELLAAACAALKAAGHVAATLTLAPGGTAERHYRAAGWLAAGETPMGGTVLKKPL